MTILETLDEIFSHITVPQNLQRKVALAKSKLAALEQKDIDRDALVVSLKAQVTELQAKNREQEIAHKVAIAELLRPEQGLVKPHPRVVMGRSNRRG